MRFWFALTTDDFLNVFDFFVLKIWECFLNPPSISGYVNFLRQNLSIQFFLSCRRVLLEEL